MVLVLDQQPAADAPGKPHAAEKLRAVTTRESSAQGSHDKTPQRVLLWVKVERVRQRGAPALFVKLSPSPSTNPDAVGFSVEEGTRTYRLLTDPRRLTRDG